MIENITSSLVDWSRAQFALTAIYHWLFVPLTLGLGVIQAVMETIYYKTGNSFWKRTAKFWMKLFGVNFAIGVATGLILEFQFGTNWSNYSWFVGDIFGAPLAIEGIVAFFMESTFIAVMYFGWEKVSKRFHLISTWLTIVGATLSAWWILVANAWMQYPVGLEFNPDTVRNEMVDFAAVALSPVAVNKFFHTVLSCWVVGAAFVIGVSCWFLLRQRHKETAIASIRIASIVGFAGIVLTLYTGDESAYQVAQKQPMKLAAMEALYEGGNGMELNVIGFLNTEKKPNDGKEPFAFEMGLPKALSILATRQMDGYVPGIDNILQGDYQDAQGKPVLSTEEKMAKGRKAIAALAAYKKAVNDDNQKEQQNQAVILKENYPYFGYGYLRSPEDIVPPVGLTYYAFRVMVGLGSFLLLLFTVLILMIRKGTLDRHKWLLWSGIASIPMAYLAGQAGWVVAEVGRQPWAIQDLMPVGAAISRLGTSSVQTTFILFLVLFTVLLIAEIGIMLRAISQGPETETHSSQS